MDHEFFKHAISQKIKYDDQKYISRGKFYVLHLDSEIMSQGVDKLNDKSENQSTIIISMNNLSKCMVTVGLQQESFPASIRFAIIQTLNKMRG